MFTAHISSIEHRDFNNNKGGEGEVGKSTRQCKGVMAEGYGYNTAYKYK